MTRRNLGLVVFAVVSVGAWFAASFLLDQQEPDSFHFKTVRDETVELFEGKNPATTHLSAEALKARKSHFSEKAGRDYSQIPGTISSDRLNRAGEELSAAVSEERRPSGKKGSSLDPGEENSLKALNLSGEGPRVRTSSGGKILSVSGRFDLASFSSGNESGLESSVTKFLEAHPKTFGLEGELSVDMARVPEEGASGDTIIRMEKRLQGLPIWGEQVVLSVVDSEVRAVTGALRSGPGNLDTEALLTRNELETITAEHLEVPRGSFEITGSERGILSYGDRFSYTYKVKVYVNPAEGWELYVAPRAQRVVLKVSTIFTQSVQSSGIDLLGQSRNFNSLLTSEGDYMMVDRSYPIGSESQVATTTFDDEGNKKLPYVRSDDPNSGWDPAGVSTAANTKLIYDYLLTKHNRNSYDNRGTKLISVTNYQEEEGACYDNAFWNGSTMFYGDGCIDSGGFFKNFAVSLDVAAHEIGHGVVEFTSTLRYENQSGALNESYADIIGVSVDPEDWNLGEDAMRNGRFLRSLINPASGINPQPGHMDDFRFLPNTKEGDWGGVHINSGIQNRAFYLLAEGNAKEGLGRSIGRDDAETIAYSALLKLTPNSDFAESANQWVIEAELNFGANSNQVTAVRQAWANVGIEISTDTSEDSSGDSGGGSDTNEDDAPEEEGPSRDVPLPPGDDVMIYLVAQDGSTGSAENPADEQYDVMLYNSDQSPDGFIEEANLGPLNEFPAAYIRPAVATLASERTLILYVRDSTKQLYYTFSDEIGEPDKLLDFGEGFTVKSIALARDGTRLALVFSEYQAYIYVYDFVAEEWSTFDVREPNYMPNDPGTLVDRVDAINFDPQGGSLIFDYRVCRAELDTDTCTELWSIGLVKLSTGIVDFPFRELQDSNIDIANPRYSQKTYEAIVLDYLDFSNYDAEGKANSAVVVLTSDGSTEILNPNQSENFDRAFGYPSFVGEDESILLQARFDDSISLYTVPLDQDYQPVGDSANSVIPFTAALSAAHVNVFVNTRTQLAINTESIDLGEVIKGKEITANFALGNFGNSDIVVTNVAPSSEEISTQLSNTSLIPGEQKTFSLTLKTNDLNLGDYSGSISIEHDADNTTVTLNITAIIANGEGGSEDAPLAPPTGLSASDGVDQALVFLTWDAVDKAEKYRVYWSDKEDGRKRRLTTIDYASSNNNPLSHDTGSDAAFYYWVTGLKGEIESPYSETDSGYAGESGNSGENDGGTGTSGSTFGGKEYRWIKERKTQEEAQAHAESLGGHLVVINSADEDDFVYSMVRDASLTGLGTASDGGGVSYVWLGGNDAASEGDWVWVNGEPFQYTNWGRAEPDDYLGQDGLAMGLQNWPDGSSGSAAYGLASEWNDISRSNQLTFIVELPSDGGSGGSTGSTGGNFSTDFVLNYAASLGPNGGCAIDDGGVDCWGTGWITGSQIPSLSNPVQLSVGTSHACALDDTGVVCWGYNDDGRADVPALSNPYLVAVKYNTTCALDDTGVVCWGDNSSGQTDVPALSNPREVALGFHTTCALDDSGIVCWGDDTREVISDIPATVNPSNLTMGDLHACVMDNDRVLCWSYDFLSKNTTQARSSNQPDLINPRELVAGGYHVCAIDDHGLKCWGRNVENQLEMPSLINPSRAYAAGQFGSCALDDNGLQCWGSEVSDSNSEKERSLAEFPNDLSFVSSGQRVVTQYLQTTSSSQNITTLNVVNSSDRSQTFRGILRSGSGEKVGADEPVLGADVPPMGRLTLDSSDLETIFGIEPWRGPAMLTIKGDNTFDLMSKLESPSGLVSNTNCVRDNRVLNLEGFDSNNMSYLRLINTGAKTTKAIRGTLYGGNGNVVGNANAELVAKLDPYQQTWINRNQLSSLIGAEWNGEGMLEVNVTPGLKLLNLNFITDESTFFNFSCADKATLLAEPSSSSDPANIGRIYLQTTSTSQNVSLTHLVNTSGSAQQYTGTLYASDGTQVGSADQPLHSGTVPSKGRLILSSTDIESAFSISPWRGPAMLEVKGDGLFELMTKLESPSGLISNTNCVRTEQVHNIGGFDQTDVTYVRFINVGDTAITNIRGSLYDNAGVVVGETNPVLVEELPAKSHVWRNRNQLSDSIGNTWNGTASLKIENADTNLRLLNLNFINSETFFNFSCYETGQ